jgi:hypothetical protein
MGSVRIFLYCVVELSTILGEALACKKATIMVGFTVMIERANKKLNFMNGKICYCYSIVEKYGTILVLSPHGISSKAN